MPTNSCHPIAPHKKMRIPNWYVSTLMLERALDAILKRIQFDRNHDIPYLAGYSLDGKTVYIDRHLPETFLFKGKAVPVDRYLVLHEMVEKTLIDQLNLHYLHAHQIATRAEQAAVRGDGIEWRAYDRFMQKNVKRAGDERLTKLPANLDEKPYRDEHDTDLLVRMEKAMKSGKVVPPKKTAAKKPAAKKAIAKQGAVKKTSVKKTAAKKVAVKKTAVKKASPKKR